MADPAPAGWLSLSFEAVANALANSAGIRALLGAADAAAARAKIYFQDVRGPIAPPYAIVALRPGQVSIDPAARVPRHTDTVSVYLVWPEIRQDGDSANGIALRASNAFGAAIDDLVSLTGTGTTYPIEGDIGYEPPERCPDDHQRLANCWDASITFDWSL